MDWICHFFPSERRLSDRTLLEGWREKWKLCNNLYFSLNRNYFFSPKIVPQIHKLLWGEEQANEVDDMTWLVLSQMPFRLLYSFSLNSKLSPSCGVYFFLNGWWAGGSTFFRGGTPKGQNAPDFTKALNFFSLAVRP